MIHAGIRWSLTSGFLWSQWRGKRSRHSQRMRNPQFYVSGKRPKDWLEAMPHTPVTAPPCHQARTIKQSTYHEPWPRRQYPLLHPRYQCLTMWLHSRRTRGLSAYDSSWQLGKPSKIWGVSFPNKDKLGFGHVCKIDIHDFLCTNPCRDFRHDFNGNLAKPPLKLGHRVVYGCNYLSIA